MMRHNKTQQSTSFDSDCVLGCSEIAAPQRNVDCGYLRTRGPNLISIITAIKKKHKLNYKIKVKELLLHTRNGFTIHMSHTLTQKNSTNRKGERQKGERKVFANAFCCCILCWCDFLIGMDRVCVCRCVGVVQQLHCVLTFRFDMK